MNAWSVPRRCFSRAPERLTADDTDETDKGRFESVFIRAIRGQSFCAVHAVAGAQN
jgi:hypothetical protein